MQASSAHSLMTELSQDKQLAYEVISTTAHLEEFCARIAASKETLIGLDTEFHRTRSYYPILCLLQVATFSHRGVIDCLSDSIDFSALCHLLLRDDKIKILHSGRQDIEIFLKILGKIPSPLFDTQIAAMACGFGDQVSLEQLLKEIIGVKIDKSVRYCDWRKRPLSQRQLDYAIEDTLYLPELYQWFNQELNKLKRYHWIEDEMEKLLSPDLYLADPEKAWERLKVGKKLKNQELNILKSVASCREKLAQQKNIPRNFVCDDKVLINMALKKPFKIEDWKKIDYISKGFIKSDIGNHFLKAVKVGFDRPLESKTRHYEKSSENKMIVGFLRILLQHYCQNHRFSALLVANMDDLSKLASKGEKADIPALLGWRYDFFGADALALLRGEISLSLEGEQLIIHRTNGMVKAGKGIKEEE